MVAAVTGQSTSLRQAVVNFFHGLLHLFGSMAYAYNGQFFCFFLNLAFEATDLQNAALLLIMNYLRRHCAQLFCCLSCL